MTQASNPFADASRFPMVREVPYIGVAWTVDQASKKGYRGGAADWVNFGQGQPEIGDIPGAPQRIRTAHAEPQDAELKGTQQQVVETQDTQSQAPALPFTPTADSVPLQGADEQAFVLKCAQALGVPTDQPGITYQLTEQYYWEGGALDLLTIVFRGQDGYQASGECTVEDGPIKGIAGWSSTEL